MHAAPVWHAALAGPPRHQSVPLSATGPGPDDRSGQRRSVHLRYRRRCRSILLRGPAWLISPVDATRLVSDGYPGGTIARCRHCHKPIIWPGLCYTCATGLPRRLGRQVEALDAGPAHAAQSADQPSRSAWSHATPVPRRRRGSRRPVRQPRAGEPRIRRRTPEGGHARDRPGRRSRPGCAPRVALRGSRQGHAQVPRPLR